MGFYKQFLEGYPTDGRLVGPQSQPERFRKQETALSLQGTEPRFVVVCSLYQLSYN